MSRAGDAVTSRAGDAVTSRGEVVTSRGDAVTSRAESRRTSLSERSDLSTTPIRVEEKLVA